MGSWLRPAVGRAFESVPFDRALSLLERADRGQRDLLAALTYHRVAYADAIRGYPGLVSASPYQFEEQMDFLARRFRVVALDDVLEARKTGRPLGRHAVMLTFDDAYRDFGEYAWPALRLRRLPATLFVPTAYPGQADRAFWWDWLYEALTGASDGAVVQTPAGTLRLSSYHERLTAYRRIRAEVKRGHHDAGMALVADVAGEQLGTPPPPSPVLDWSDLRALAAEGVALAPHSRTHPLLDRIEPVELARELAGSLADLEQRVGTTPPAFAYPSGSYSEAVRTAVSEAGFSVAFTTRRGLNRLGRTDWLTLRRINVGRASSLNALRAQLGSWALAWSR